MSLLGTLMLFIDLTAEVLVGGVNRVSSF